ncbi:MAG: ATP synthase F1 subunit epsilon [Magnetococcales bacterium]|nr:ATP synthase F1 subunit epsilon [Magnetococcales bacterium]
MDILQLEVVTPERLLLTTDTGMVTIPGQDGLFGVLPGHTPFLSGVKAGHLIVGEAGKGERYAISHGFAQIYHNQVTLLVDQAIAEKELNPKAANRELGQAKEALQGVSPDDPAHAACQERLAFAEACCALINPAQR